VTIRYEGAYAERTTVEAVPAGEELGGDVLDRPALAFGYDEVFFVVGSPAELVAFADRVHAAASRLTGAPGHPHPGDDTPRSPTRA
jgi:hypothetical protein